jgi:hypothetical protein
MILIRSKDKNQTEIFGYRFQKFHMVEPIGNIFGAPVFGVCNDKPVETG